MAKQRKWNNQGGSGRGDKPSKPKDPLPNIPAFDKLRESNEVSFKLSKIRPPQPNYGAFGDEIWTDWQPIIDPAVDVDNYEIDIDLNDNDGELPLLSDNIRTIPILDDDEYGSYIRSRDERTKPLAAYKEYEITVKFKRLVLTILSGQAYAARNQLNNPLLDFSLVIISSEAIKIGQNPPGTLNVIQLLNTTLDPAFSLYAWVLDKIKIATDNTGKAPDPILLRLSRAGSLPLPPTSFTWNSKQYNLFNSSGDEPTQICLHAINDVVKFDPTTPKTAFWKWSVLLAGEPLPLCKSISDIYQLIGLNLRFNSDVGFNVFLLNYRAEDEYAYPDDINANITFNSFSLIFRIFGDEETLEEIDAETGYYCIFYLKSNNTAAIKLERGQPSAEVELPITINNWRRIAGFGFLTQSDATYYNFDLYCYYVLALTSLSISGSANAIATTVSNWENSNPTVKRKIQLINGVVNPSGWIIQSDGTLFRDANIQLQQIDSNLPLFKDSISYGLNGVVIGWMVNRTFTYGTRSKSAEVLMAELKFSAYNSSTNIYTNSYHAIVRSTILERDEFTYFAAKTYLAGSGRLSLDIETRSSGTTFELEGEATDLWYCVRTYNANTGAVNGNWQIRCRMKANYQRRFYTIPATETAKIDGDTVEINSLYLEQNNVTVNSGISTITGINISRKAVYIASQIETTYRNYNYVNNGSQIPTVQLVDGTASSVTQTSIVRQLEPNPFFAGLKYAILISPSKIYNLSIDSLISTTSKSVADDPESVSQIPLINEIGFVGQDFGFYPIGYRYSGQRKSSWTNYNLNRDWGSINNSWKFEFPMSITPATPPGIPVPDFPKYHPFLSIEAIGYQSSNIPSTNTYDQSSLCGTYTAINSSDPDAPNIHWSRIVTGFNCSIVSEYDIDLPISGNRLILPHPAYFENNSSLLGKTASGEIQIYRSRDKSGSIPAYTEKWIVNNSNRLELVDIIIPDVYPDSVTSGTANFGVQYYPN